MTIFDDRIPKFCKEVAEEEDPLESRGIVGVTKCGRTEPNCSLPKTDVLRQNTGVTGGRKNGGRVQEKGRSAIEEEEEKKKMENEEKKKKKEKEKKETEKEKREKEKREGGGEGEEGDGEEGEGEEGGGEE